MTSVPFLSRRARMARESPTIGFNQRVKRLCAAGEKVFQFQAGDVKAVAPPSGTGEIIAAAYRERCTFHYPDDPRGLLSLREALSSLIWKNTGLTYDPKTEILVVGRGCKGALARALQLTAGEHDVVLVPKVGWPSTADLVSLNGSCVAFIGSEHSVADGLNGDAIRHMRHVYGTNRTIAALVVQNCTNPTGHVYTAEQCEDMAQAFNGVAMTGVVIEDHVYMGIVHGGMRAPVPYRSFASISPEWRKRTIGASSLTKLAALADLRLGFVFGDAELIGVLARILTQDENGFSTGLQEAVCKMIRDGCIEETQSRIVACARGNLAYVRDWSASQPSGAPLRIVGEPAGSIYVLLDVSPFIGRRIHEQHITSTLDFTTALLEHERVAVNPGEDFGAPHTVRLNLLSMGADSLRQGLDAISAFVAKLS